MHRLVGLLTSLGLLAFAVGCHHTAGVCDCLDHGCGGHCTANADTYPTVLSGVAVTPGAEKVGEPKEKDSSAKDKDKGKDKDKDKTPDKE